MRSTDTSPAPFVIGYCAACAAQVLTWMDLDAAGHEYRRCLDCDTAVCEALEPAGVAALETRGYEIRDPAANQGGCRCATGGCGRRPAAD